MAVKEVEGVAVKAGQDTTQERVKRLPGYDPKGDTYGDMVDRGRVGSFPLHVDQMIARTSAPA